MHKTIILLTSDHFKYNLDSSLSKDFSLLFFEKIFQHELYNPEQPQILQAMGASCARMAEKMLIYANKKNTASAYLLFNPKLNLTNQQLATILIAVQSTQIKQWAYWTTPQNVPLALFIPALPENLFFLRFLSWTDAVVDQQLLNQHNISTTATSILEIEESQYSNVFYRADQEAKLLAQHYVSAVKPAQQYILLCPYHAGDVLFACLALKKSRHPFTALMINQSYIDIVKRVLPDMPILALTMPPPDREGMADLNEIIYFNEYIYPQIPKDIPFYNFRCTQNHQLSNMHLIDQFRYALTDEPMDFIQDQKIINPPIEGTRDKKKILLHLDGGWHLKKYPLPYQKILLKQLIAAGFNVTVISSDHLDITGIQWEKFQNLAQIEQLIRNHDLILGMDSFPIHFAIHVLEHPSIILFSSTRPENATGPQSNLIKYYNNNLSCSPCHHKNVCKRFEINHCVNFLKPEMAFAAIINLYKTLMNESDSCQEDLSRFSAKAPYPQPTLIDSVIGSAVAQIQLQKGKMAIIKGFILQYSNENIFNFIRRLFGFLKKSYQPIHFIKVRMQYLIFLSQRVKTNKTIPPTANNNDGINAAQKGGN